LHAKQPVYKLFAYILQQALPPARVCDQCPNNEKTIEKEGHGLQIRAGSGMFMIMIPHKQNHNNQINHSKIIVQIFSKNFDRPPAVIDKLSNR